jgi:hypothetical protein
MESNNQKNIFAPNESSTSVDILSNFLKDNGLEETKQEIYEKIKNGKSTKATILKRIVLNFADVKIPDKELPVLLVKELGAQEAKIDELIKNIKSVLLPLVKKVEIQEETPVSTPINKTMNSGPDKYRESIE